MKHVAIAGVGYTSFTRRSGRTVLDLATEACRNAVTDAGLARDDVDGVGSFSIFSDSVPCSAVATALALPGLRYTLDLNAAGQSPCHAVLMASLAISAGHADAIVIFRALNGRSGLRIGHGAIPGGAGAYRYPIGYSSYLMYIAMWARRYMIETGATDTDLGAVAVAQRWYAQRNDRAVMREPLDIDGYYHSPIVCDPFRAADCTSEVDGACAVLVTSLERARDLRQPPAVIASTAYRAGARPGLDVGDQLQCDDYSRNFTGLLREELYGRAGVTAADVSFAEIYDCFTSTVLFGLEGLGLCGRGEAGDFIRSGATAIGGRLPTNTSGGLLAEGYLHGMNVVTEAVMQIQGRCGERQAPRHDVGVVTSGALIDGSAMILMRDR
jgi:acetyl-CoA acetyltransferase